MKTAHAFTFIRYLMVFMAGFQASGMMAWVQCCGFIPTSEWFWLAGNGIGFAVAKWYEPVHYRLVAYAESRGW